MKRSFLHIIVVVLICLLGVNSLKAQPENRSLIISGKVIEAESKEALEYVNVAVYSGTDSSLITGMITSKEGTFEIKINKPGNYYLTADFVGYEKKIIKDIIVKSGNEKVDLGVIELQQAYLGIDEVEVVAERPYVSYKLDRKVVEVSRNPSAQGGTAVDALENVPSIQTDMEGNVSLRGSSSFTVLIDGRQTALTGTDALNQIPASAIDKIEIITNPSVKYDPDGTTGIINIISKKNALRGHTMVANASVGTSPMYSADLNYSYRKEKITFNGGINYRNHQRTVYNTSDQFIDLIDTTTNEVDTVINLYKKSEGDRQFQIFSVKGGFDYELFEGNVMNATFSFNDFIFQRGSDTRISNYNNSPLQNNRYSSDGFKTSPQNWQFNIGDKHIFNENKDHYISFDAMYQTGKGTEMNYVESRIADMDWNVVGQDTVDRRTETKGKEVSYRVELDYMRPIGDNFIFEAGYTLRIDQENQDYSYFVNYPDQQDWIKVSERDDNSFYQRNINAGWALFKGQVVGLNVSGGLRAEHTYRYVETEKDNYEFKYDSIGLYPSFAVSKEFAKGDVLQASYSRRVNRPRPWHLSPFPRLTDGYTQYIPNPELEPEYTNSVEVNFQKSLKGMSFLSLETFYHYTDNKIERLDLVDSDTLVVYTRENLDSDTRVGAELGGHVKLSSWFSFQPGFSVYYYETMGEIQGEQRKVSDVSYDGRLTTNFILPTKTRIQLMGFYRGPEVEISEEQAEMYWLSAAVRQELMDRKLTLTLRVDDIFATRKRLDTGYFTNSVVYSEGYRDSPTFVLSVSYRLNQSDKKNGNYREGSGNGGGMDMDY